MKQQIMATTSSQLDRDGLADIIQRTIEESGKPFKERLEVTRVVRDIFIAVKLSDIKTQKSIYYIVMSDRIIGPDHSDHKGNTLIDALVLNVYEALASYGFRYIGCIGYKHIPGSELSPEIP